MFDKTTIVLATNNQKKRKEFAVLLGDQLSMACMADFQLESPAETGRTFWKTRLLKPNMWLIRLNDQAWLMILV